MQRVLVTGADGFIGHHLVAHLKKEGCWVRGTNITERGSGSGTGRALRACSGRNADNSRLAATLGWQPQATFQGGLVATCSWIREENCG